MGKELILDLMEVISKDKNKIREKRKLKNKRRLELLYKLDFLLKKVEHINTDDFSYKKNKEEQIIFKEIENIKIELENISKRKGYKVIDPSKEYFEEQQKQVKKENLENNSNTINSVLDIDILLSKEKVVKMRETMGLKEIAEKYNINYKSMRNWCYSRGVNKMVKGKKVVSNRWKKK